MRVTWVGHSTTVFDLGGIRFLTDPLLRPNAGLLRRAGPAPDPQQWAGTGIVLVSHLHHDHAELASLRSLAGVRALAAQENAGWLRGKDVPAEPLGEGWVDLSGAAVQVRAVRAEHMTRRMPHRPSEAIGFLVRSPAATVWFAGDTAFYPQMADLVTLAEGPIDLALLPIHGWGPRLSEGHLDPAGAAEVCAQVRPRAVLPIHHGTFYPLGFGLVDLDWMQRPGREFAAELRSRAPATELVGLDLGESADVG